MQCLLLGISDAAYFLGKHNCTNSANIKRMCFKVCWRMGNWRPHQDKSPVWRVHPQHRLPRQLLSHSGCSWRRYSYREWLPIFGSVQCDGSSGRVHRHL